MAATQAEKQQNDVNCEKVQPDQQHLNVRNSLLQNGTDKSGVRGGGSGVVAPTKTKNTAGNKNLVTDMSQYRQEGNGGGGGGGGGNGGGGGGPTANTAVPTGAPPGTNVNDPGPVDNEQTNNPITSTGGPPNASDSTNVVYSTVEGPPPPPPPNDAVGAYGFPYGRDVMNSVVEGGGGGVHAFGPRQSFTNPKQPPPGVPFASQHQQRFAVSGQTLSQPTGPTPTLNQLLQSGNPMPLRYPNNYGHPEQSYNQAWPTQKNLTTFNPGQGVPPAPYRNQPTLSPAYGGGSVPSPGYGEGRSGWLGPPVSGQHGPGSPGPPNASSAPASQPSPQPPSHSPGPCLPPSPQHQAQGQQQQPTQQQQQQTSQQQQQQQQQQTSQQQQQPPSQQQSGQHQAYQPNRPAQPTTPNAHAPDAADLSGGNSNDSSGGPAPGTPNSQGMRPTPSPTGSTGSRSMSPAVGQQNIPMPPRPSSGQSDGSGPTRMSHSPMATQGNYPTQHTSAHPAHVHGYKTHPGMVGGPTGGGQPMPLYQPNQQYPQGGYPPRPPQANLQYPGQGYGPPPASSQAPPPSSTTNMSPQQYPTNRSSNHMPNSQFPPYQQPWQGPVNIPKGNGPPPAPGSPSAGGPPRPPHYLKQHLQHKIAYGGGGGGGGNVPGSAPPSPSPPQNYHMGPPPTGHHHSGMGPPPSMGPPPNMPPASSPLMSNSHSHDGPMPPPSSTPNSHTQMAPEMMDNGITTTAQGGLSTHVTTAAGGFVTSVVTTGPDGTPIDEGSQQSTLSNASAASGEDPQCTTPKSNRKNDMGHYSHPTTPQSTVPSPGAASMNSMHDEFGELNSPSWPRTPASPVFNSHVPPPDTYRSKKTDSLGKLYEMDDSPERRGWLDKLLAFMEERRTPITTCPTISKNPLDLFRLYVYVKDRGGFMEVTKNKTWKDIAGMLGIGASSSAAYTLRKHYTKNLLAYECQFDRGGIDPQPIINQVEATSKKKGAKSASVPSPGSSNSQDSFPPPGSGGTSMDGYGGYGYPPPAGNPEYNATQRPSSQTNAPSPHGGSQGANHMNNTAPGGPSPAGGAADNVSVSNPFDDVSPSPPPRGGPFPGGPHSSYPSGTPPRPQSQGYTGQGGYNQYPGPGPGAPPDQYSQYSAGSGYPPAVRPVYPPYSGDSGAPPAPPNPNNNQGPPVSAQDPYNRYNMGNAPGSGYSPRPAYAGAPGNAGPPTSQPPTGSYSTQQEYYRPDQNYPNQQGASGATNYPGVPTANKNMPPPGPQPPRRHPDFAKDQQPYPQFGQQRPQMYGWSNNNQYRPPQYGPSVAPPVGAQQWNQGGRPSGQWDRYPAGNPGYQPPQQGQQWGAMPTANSGQSSPLRPPLGGPRPGKPFPMLPPQGGKGTQPSSVPGGPYPQNQLPKREITFPPDSVEATLPVLYRRKRLCRSDLGQVDPWRIVMSLKSGLLCESTYAFDILNVLLFDDTAVGYFGLNQWPGLLDLLLEHFQKSLSDIFDGPFPRDEKPDEGDVDLGGVVKPVDANMKTLLLNNTNNYTYITRKGYQVKLVDRKDDIFIQDHLKDWDKRGDVNYSTLIAEINTDPWHLETEFILSTFQAEFGRIPFHTRLEDRRKSIDRSKKDKEHTPPPTADETPPLPKCSDRKRRTRTLSDVISRIKKDSTEANNVLTLETYDKVKTEVVSDSNANCDEKNNVGLDLNANSSGANGDENGENIKCDNDTGNENSSGLKIKDPAGTLKRRRSSDYEDEAYTRDEASLVLITESQDNVGKRCVCISNILRSLTFIPGNEIEFARNSTFLAVVGKLLLLHHEHPPRTQKTRNYDREEDADFADSCSSLQGENEWWWDFLVQIRENVLVSLANISGQIDFNIYPEEIVRPILDGLLHWAICPSASGQDPFASVGPSSLLSPQRLALESLCKLCVTNNNVDLVIATPPFSRLERLCAVLTKHLCRSEDQVLREFSINLLHYLAAADSSMARVVASQTPCISLLVAFIEQAEQSALGVANQHGIGALRDNPDSMGTSLDMLRRAAATLVFLARHHENKPLLVQQESRLLALVMSQILDQQVALLLSKVLFQISRS